MVFAATNNPNDTSDQTVVNLPYYPDITVDAFRKTKRVQDTITDQRVIEAIQTAMINVNDQLATWKEKQELLGYATLANVPSDDYNGTTRHQHCYLTALYARAKSILAENYRDIDTTPDGDNRANELENTVDFYLTESTVAIRKILGKTRSTIELT